MSGVIVFFAQHVVSLGIRLESYVFSALREVHDVTAIPSAVGWVVEACVRVAGNA